MPTESSFLIHLARVQIDELLRLVSVARTADYSVDRDKRSTIVLVQLFSAHILPNVTASIILEARWGFFHLNLLEGLSPLLERRDPACGCIVILS